METAPKSCVFLVAGLVTGWVCISAPAADESRKNVVFLLVDDLGWSDLSCYGSDYHETPYIDTFARQGVKFTSAYAAAPVCSPTRAAILTGKFPARLGMTIWHEGAVAGGPQDRPLLEAHSLPNLPHEERTLAERFSAEGYFTAHIGKWHLGTAAFYPETQGYDLNIGGTFWGAPSTFFFPFRGPWTKSDPEFRYVPGLSPGKQGDYLTDRLTDKALSTIEAVRDRPFFLSLWYHTVHTPIEAPAVIVEQFRRKAPGARHHNATYAAMVQRMDHNVGRVLRKLDELGLSQRTAVIITSDNGGVDFEARGMIPTTNAPLRAGKGTLYEGGLRVPLLIRWPGETTAGATCDEPVCSQDFFPTFAEAFPPSDEATTVADGVSLLPLLRDPAQPLSRESLYWHFPHYYPRMTPASAIRKGRWKLIHYYEDGRTELFDLAADPSESSDLAQSETDRVIKLKRDLDHWRMAVGANSPRDNPAFEGHE